ncbi:uncharacterized protein [Coffea arabica]|uniref:Reverse transcriptase Ty1/copia-type domain-containing protein n=1 Tax=Coffea arabica TaxID=13443 RepID=A0ABM4X809_COFAR
MFTSDTSITSTSKSTTPLMANPSITGSTIITTEKLKGNNYSTWAADVELWFMGQGYKDHLTTKPNDTMTDPSKWERIDAQLCSMLWQTIDSLLKQIFRPHKTCFSVWEQAKTLYTNDISRVYVVCSDLMSLIAPQKLDMPMKYSTIRDQILASPIIPILSQAFSRLLRLPDESKSSSETIVVDSSALASQSNQRGGRGRGRDREPTLKPEYEDFVKWFTAKQSSTPTASAVHTSNASACVSQSPSLGPWVLDSAATDHISSNPQLFSSLHSSTSLPNITLADGSQTQAKGIDKANPLPSVPLDSVPFIPNCPFSLVYVRRLYRSLNCLVTFDEKSLNKSEHSRITEDIPVSIYFVPLTHDTDIKQPLKESLPSPTSPPLLTYQRRNVRNSPTTVPDNGVGESADLPDASRTIPSSSPTTISPPTSPPIAIHKGEVMSHSGWRQAMIDEMAALHSNFTWELVSLPPGKLTVGCHWIYTVEVGSDGQIDRLKARLIVKGYTQIFGLDYTDIFSPVAKMSSVRLILSLSTVHHWPLHQLDIKNAFLHGALQEEVYMDQPPDFVIQGKSSGMVCRLKRAFYGLEQSPRACSGRFRDVVQKYGMIRSEADHSVFYRHSPSKGSIYLVVYVDDIISLDKIMMELLN